MLTTKARPLLPAREVAADRVWELLVLMRETLTTYCALPEGSPERAAKWADWCAMRDEKHATYALTKGARNVHH